MAVNQLWARQNRIEQAINDLVRRIEAQEKLAQRDTQRFALTPFGTVAILIAAGAGFVGGYNSNRSYPENQQIADRPHTPFIQVAADERIGAESPKIGRLAQNP